MLTVAVGRSFNWLLRFSNPAWHMTIGKFPLKLTFDGNPPWDAMAETDGPQSALIRMPANEAMINAFRYSRRMQVIAAANIFTFDLDATSKLLPELATCVQTEVASQGGETPGVAQSDSRLPSNPVPQSPQVASSTLVQAAATRIASNLLLQAKLPNARILSPAEVPGYLKNLGVVWQSDLGLGAVQVAAPTAYPNIQQAAVTIINAGAVACQGDFASGRSTEMVDNLTVTKIFTQCRASSSTLSMQYFIGTRRRQGIRGIHFSRTAIWLQLSIQQQP